MEKYWIVNLVEHHDTKKKRVQLLCKAVSPTDAEAKVYKDFEGESNFTVDKIVKTKIIKIIS